MIGKWHKATVLALVAALPLLEPLGRLARSAPAGSERDAEQRHVIAAVLLRLSKSSRTRYPDPDWTTLCVRVGTDGAERSLLAQVHGFDIPALPASDCGIQPGARVRALPAKHLLLFVDQVSWHSQGLVTIHAGDYLGNMAATGYALVLVRAWGRWWVLRQTQEWIA
jgi:hypothetical protein